jgi:predicted site-specific integrase-resolvase
MTEAQIRAIVREELAGMVPREALTIKQVAESLQVSPTSVHLWRKRGELRMTNVGGKRAAWRCSPEELRRFEGRRRV